MPEAIRFDEEAETAIDEMNNKFVKVYDSWLDAVLTADQTEAPSE